MKRKDLLKRICAILMTMVMALSMSGLAFAEDTAEEGTDLSAEKNVTEDEEAAEDAEVFDEETDIEEILSEDDEIFDEEGSVDEDAAEEEPAEEEGTMLHSLEAETLEEISVRAAGDESKITAVWSEAEGADHYKVYLDGGSVQTIDSSKERSCVFTGVSTGSLHTVTVEAYRLALSTNEETSEEQTGEDQDEPQYEKYAEGTDTDIKALFRSKLGTKKLGASSMGLSLRKKLGEGNNGYAVAQGAATDGKYAYYLQASSANQKCRVLKVNLSNSSDYKKGPVINAHHGNGMTYDSKRGKLVACGYGKYRHQLTYIDPNTLQITSQPYLKYSYVDKMSGVADNAENNGIAAIAYVAEYDVYVARSRGKVSGYSNTTSSANNNIWVFDAETLEAIGHIYTKVCSSYPNTYQAMDADEKYVYFLLSPGSGQKKNIILALDWNSENILPVVNGDKKYVDKMWKCNNNGTGKPDAVLTIPISHESEGLFHTTDANGKEHFYVSEYYGRWKYKTITKKVKYKKKWKKVRKWYNKKTKKWTTKKPPKKYRGKSKKVWKYKKKTKKVKKKVKDYWARDDYVYDLGVI